MRQVFCVCAAVSTLLLLLGLSINTLHAFGPTQTVAGPPQSCKKPAYATPPSTMVSGCTVRDKNTNQCIVGSCKSSSDGWQSAVASTCATTQAAGTYTCNSTPSPPVTDTVTIEYVEFGCNASNCNGCTYVLSGPFPPQTVQLSNGVSGTICP